MIFWAEKITNYTVIYGVYIRSWSTLNVTQAWLWGVAQRLKLLCWRLVEA